MMQSTLDNEVIVIGGGVSGLAAAAFIAKAGKRVSVFEQSQALGGRAQTKEQNGFYLNLGPHALYRGGRGIEVLRDLGVEPKGRVPSVSGAFAIKDGVKHTFPAGAVSLFTTSLFGLSAKLEAARFLASIAKIDCEHYMNVSVSEWLDRTISHSEVKDFILAAFRVATYTNAPDLMSAGTALAQLQKAFDKSVLYLDAGWQTIVDGLRDVAQSAGVNLQTGVRIDAVTRDADGWVNGVRLSDGTRIPTSTVVIASNPAAAVQLVENARDSSLSQWAETAIPVRAACLDVALSRLPKEKATFALGIDRPLYLSVHSASARLAPDGSALIQTAKYLPPDDQDSAEDVEKELEGLLDLVQPEWRGLVVYRRFLPEMTVVNSLPLARLGGTDGRPDPEVTDIPGLFIAGDWVGSEGMLADASLSSARKAAKTIVSYKAAAAAISI
ncbi:MAG TPA: FAD-dependent oxidoreductase [Blastocatellia bacterium]|nr:FAD-dependent oxidoreductase [Blastocatellia bacterium]